MSDLRGPPAGLCATCRHAHAVANARGSRFVLCELSRTDARFPRYPALPVIACSGHETPADDLQRNHLRDQTVYRDQ